METNIITRCILWFAALIVLHANTAFSQSYTPVPYDFPARVSGVDHTVFSAPLDFVSMASNGYGHWGATSDGRWYLMSNDLPIGWTSLHETEPKGPVQGGMFINDFYWSGGFKVATNLRGSVRYVAPTNTHGSFNVFGFDDEHIPDTPEVNIRFEGIPKANNSRLVVKNGHRTFPVVSTPGSSIISATHEADWRDWFDIACDGTFLYITWTEWDALANNFDVWVTCVDLLAGTVQSGFPFEVTLDPLPAHINTALFGRRPTIACDIRHNSNPATAAPKFDIAYIGKTGVGGPARVMHFHYNNGAKTLTTLQNSVKYQSTTSPIPYNSPTHCRILVSSTEGTPSKVKVVYALIDPDLNETTALGLVMYRITSEVVPRPQTPQGHYATYVDGSINPYFSRPAPVADGFWNVYEEPIIAFTNPYDGKPDSTFSEFHCLYNLEEDTSEAFPPFNPLFIVRADNNGFHGVSDTRTVLSSTRIGLTDSLRTMESEGVGGANQQGIYVTWTDSDPGEGTFLTHAKRDRRHLDEDIEENTLLSHTNIVGDGLSHGGTVGAKLRPSLKLTMWTDLRSYAEFDSSTVFDSALFYAPYKNYNPDYLTSSLRFQNGDTSEVMLTIGDPSAVDSTKSIFTVLPNHLILFEDSTDLGQKIIVNPHSELHYYGIQPKDDFDHPYGANIAGAGEIRFNPHSELTIHGGAELKIPTFVELNADTTAINFPFEQHVWPPYADSLLEDANGLNFPANGLLSIHGTATLIACGIDARNEGVPTKIIDLAAPIFETTSPFADHFIADNCSFTSGHVGAGPGIDGGVWACIIEAEKEGGGGVIRGVEITNSAFYGFVISGYNLTNRFIVDDNVFQRHYFHPAVRLTNFDNSAYQGISISGNEIEMDGVHGASDVVDGVADGIVLAGFNRARSSSVEQIEIANNYIHTGGGTDQEAHAINLYNTSALVTGNIIDNPFGVGIQNMYDTILAATSHSNTFICANTITNCKVGISTRKWNGHARMNRVSESGVGHLSGALDAGGITFSRYFDNEGPGLYLSDITSSIDLSGQDINDSTFLAAFDTIDHNNESRSASQGEIRINGATTMELNLGHPDTLVYPFTDTLWAFNSIVSDTAGQKLIYNEGDSVTIGITANFWGSGTNWNSLTAITTRADLAPLLRKVGFLPNTPVMGSAPFARPSVPVCGVDFSWGIKPKGGQSPQAMNDGIDTPLCKYLRQRGDLHFDLERWAEADDTLRLYIENCANDYGSAAKFNTIGSAVSRRSNIKERYQEYREWLKKVLYYNTKDSNYYCADVDQIMGSFAYYSGRGEPDYLGALAVLKFIKESGRCSKWYFIKEYNSQVNGTFAAIYDRWKDTVQDTINTKPDSTLPTLEELDLTILYGPSEVVDQPMRSSQREILHLSASGNPFKQEVELNYELSDGAMVRINIFDQLGRSMYAEGLGWQSSGKKSIRIDGNSWAEGVYYARLFTLRGEIRTVKLVKE